MKKLFLGLLIVISNHLNAECLDASEYLSDDGSYNLKKMTQSLQGFLGTKNATHPSRGFFSSPILIFKEGTCIKGHFISPENNELINKEIIAMTHIQLSLPSNQMDSFKKNKGNLVYVKGHFSFSSNANHTTHPFFFVVDKINESF